MYVVSAAKSTGSALSAALSRATSRAAVILSSLLGKGVVDKKWRTDDVISLFSHSMKKKFKNLLVLF
jgi:hypothetical protein